MWKLGKLKIPRTTVTQPGEITNSEYIATENLDTNLYNDITSISNWKVFGEYVGFDYKFIRKRIQELTPVDGDESAWNALSIEDRTTISQLKATSLSRVREVLGSEMNISMNSFDISSQNCRTQRFGFAKSVLLNNVERNDAFSILVILENDGLIDKYIYQGIEGTLDNDPIEALFNFIEATPLTQYGGQTKDILGNNLGKYENTGLLRRNLTFQIGAQISNNQDIVNVIMGYLRDGV